MVQRKDHTVRAESNAFYKRGNSWNPFGDEGDDEMDSSISPARIILDDVLPPQHIKDSSSGGCE